MGTAKSTTASTAPAQNPVDPAAVQALKSMGDYLQSLKRYEVSIDASGERVLRDGQKLMHMASADLQVAQPNRVKARTSTASLTRELSYDGKKVTLNFPTAKYYSQVDYSGTVAQLIGKLRADYGVDFPAADLFVWGTPAAPFDNLQSAMNAGQAVVNGTLCDHYVFRQPGLDWQLWLKPGSEPVPMRLVVTNLGDEARPQSVTDFKWNLKPAFKDSTFTYVPPAGAKSVPFTPIKK